MEEVDRSGQKWTEIKILDFIFQLEYLRPARMRVRVRVVLRAVEIAEDPGLLRREGHVHRAGREGLSCRCVIPCKKPHQDEVERRGEGWRVEESLGRVDRV